MNIYIDIDIHSLPVRRNGPSCRWKCRRGFGSVRPAWGGSHDEASLRDDASALLSLPIYHSGR